jgi:hypothetical protein
MFAKQLDSTLLQCRTPLKAAALCDVHEQDIDA